jgi:hypothetical protein
LVHKVRVQLEGTNALNMREVQVFDYDNVNKALNKNATQSSMWQYWRFFAGEAVNGIWNDADDMSHTNSETGKFFRVS